MLTKFAVTNYRGFARRIELDLTHPRDYAFNSFAIQDGIIKNGIVYGPNGCGKTNLSLAIFDIVNHLSQKKTRPDYYDNFVYAGATKENVKFEYTFKFGSSLLEYVYSKDSHGVLKNETLTVDNRPVFIQGAGALTIDTHEFPLDESAKKKLADSANNISLVNYLLSAVPLPKNHYLLKLQAFVNSMLWYQNLDKRTFIGLETGSSLIYEYIIQQGFVDDFANFLREVSGQRFDFVKPKQDDKELLCLIGGEPISFPQIISTGTHSLALLYFWFKKLGKASFVFIDEFDAFYHFKLSFEVCKLLFGLECQVFLSSHNTYLMTNDLLRPDCNFFLQQNVIKPLCDWTDKDLRLGHNIEKLFRGGTFNDPVHP